MKPVTLSMLMLSAAAFAGAACAQEVATPTTNFDQSYVASNVNPPADSGWNGDSPNMADIYAGKSIDMAFDLLKAGNFRRAETIFADFVQRNPRNGEGALYLGATRMELGRWEDARSVLEAAARHMPRHPDPKSRLGVTYAKLGDIAGANAQRDALVQMSIACKTTCKLSPYIRDGIRMIDEALAEPATRN